MSNAKNHGIKQIVRMRDITEQELKDLLTINEKDNMYQYLHETVEFSLDLAGSPLKTILKSKLFQGQTFECFYVHQTDRKFILLNFLYCFLKNEQNKMYDILFIQGPNKICYEEISIFLYESYHKEKYSKMPMSYLQRPTDEWLKRVINLNIITKDEQKLNSLCLPFMLEENRKIKAIIYSDVNSFDLDYRAKSNQRLTKILLDTKLIVLSFKRDYHPSKEPIYTQIQGSDPPKACSGKVTKIVSESNDKLYVKYIAPAEAYRTVTHKKQDVFRSVMISSFPQNPEFLKVTIYSPYPFEVHQQIIKKGYIEPGQNYFQRRSH